MDERFVAVAVKNKGLVVLTACSHAGVVNVLRHEAEALPFADAVFDHALIVTTICFVDNARAMLREASRVLRPGGVLVIGLIDRERPLGQDYVAHQAESVFYREAKFFSAAEVEALLTDTGFADLTWVQTLSAPLSEVHEIEPISAGTGRGAFVAVRARVKGTTRAP